MVNVIVNDRNLYATPWGGASRIITNSLLVTRKKKFPCPKVWVLGSVYRTENVDLKAATLVELMKKKLEEYPKA